jgi:hypothetical protein
VPGIMKYPARSGAAGIIKDYLADLSAIARRVKAECAGTIKTSPNR